MTYIISKIEKSIKIIAPIVTYFFTLSYKKTATMNIVQALLWKNCTDEYLWTDLLNSDQYRLIKPQHKVATGM